jgi:hypothetical protein
MARVQHTDVIIGAGAGLVVSLTKHGTTTPAVLWADATSGTELPRLVTNEYGFYSVWLDEGEYDESVPQSPQEDRVLSILSYQSLRAAAEVKEGPPGPAGPRGESGASEAPATIARVSSFPGSPVDGEEVDYVASSGSGIVWRFRFRSAGTTHKWEFIGGSPLSSATAGDITTASPTNVALTGGPSVTLPFAGEYAIDLSLTMNPASSGIALATAFVGTNETGAVAMIAAANQSILRSQVGVYKAAASEAVTIKVRNANSILTRFVNARISVVPVKLG